MRWPKGNTSLSVMTVQGNGARLNPFPVLDAWADRHLSKALSHTGCLEEHANEPRCPRSQINSAITILENIFSGVLVPYCKVQNRLESHHLLSEPNLKN